MKEKGVPRFIKYGHGDHMLRADLENTIDISHISSTVKPNTILQKNYNAVGRLETSNGDIFHGVQYIHTVRSGGYNYTNPDWLVKPAKSRDKLVDYDSEYERDLQSRVIYIKIYGARNDLDELLLGPVSEILSNLRSAGYVKRWFYINYKDPNTHLRIRLEINDKNRIRDVSEVMEDVLNQHSSTGLVREYGRSLFRPEIYRYGGTKSFSDILDYFYNCSEISIQAKKRLLEAGGIELNHTESLLAGVIKLFENAHTNDMLYKRNMANHYKKLKKSVGSKSIIYEQYSETSDIQELLESYGTIINTVCERLSYMEKMAQLCRSPHDIAISLIHMTANRILSPWSRRSEYVAYSYAKNKKHIQAD